MSQVPPAEPDTPLAPRSPADGPRVLAATILLQFAFGLVYVWGALVPYVRLTTHWSSWMIGAVWSAVPVGFGLGMIGAGRLADAYPARTLCGGAVAVMFLGFAVAFLLPGWSTLTVFYSGVALGGGAALALAGSIAAGTQLYPRHVGTVGGALTGAYALSALVLVPVTSRLAAAGNWFDALRVVGAGVLTLGVVAIIVMPDVSAPRRRTGDPPVVRIRTLFRRTPVWTGCLFEALAVVLGAAAVVTVGAYARDLHLPFSVATASVTVVGLGNAAGRLGGGRASDRFGVRRVMWIILLCDVAAAMALWRASGPAGVLIGAALGGIGLGGPAGIASRLAADAAPDAPHSVLGMLIAGYSTGSFSGPLLMAAVGLASRGWMTLAVFPVAGLGVLALTSRPRLERHDAG